jgi:hypothetical protein
MLLCGSIRTTGLAGKIGRSVLDLPIRAEHSLCCEWQRQVQGLAGLIGVAELPLRILIDQSSPRPASFRTDIGVKTAVERDPLELRGTGGILRDVAVEFEPSDYLLVCNGGQIARESLSRVSRVLADCGGDVNLIGHEDGTPSGFALVRCGCLQQLPKCGFIDLKEQALPALAKRFRIEVAMCPVGTAWPVRTLADYVEALRQVNRCIVSTGDEGRAGAYAEDWQASFGVIEPMASCATGVRIHDSVVLSGGEVGEDAAVIRSVICSGAVVRRGEKVVDEIRTMASK